MEGESLSSNLRSLRAFDEVIDFQEGPGIMARDFRSSGVPLVRLSGLERGARILDGCDFLDPGMVDDRWSHFRLQVGDVLLSTSASLGRIKVVDEQGAGAVAYTGIIRMRPKSPDLERSFIPFVLESPHFQAQVESMGVGCVIRHFGPSHLRQMKVLLPRKAAQRAIAHILGTLDAKIDLNRRTNETLEAMARALFKSWFVDFDPVHAKAAGRQPSGMDAATAALFPSEFVESELGRIPKGWTSRPVGELVTPLSGGTPSKARPEYWSGSIPWISPKVMTTIQVDDSMESVAASAIGNGTRLAPASCTLVMVRGMGLHECVRVSQARRDVTFNQDVKALVPSAITPSLLLLAMLELQPQLLGRVESAGHGTGKLPTDILLAPHVALPAAETQLRLERLFVVMLDAIDRNRQETRTLTALRDTLLPRLLSGELAIPDAERFVEAAT